MISRIRDTRLQGLTYWGKLKKLRVYCQERRREIYIVIFLWKLSQGRVEGYYVSFTPYSSRTGRKVETALVLRYKAEKGSKLKAPRNFRANLLPHFL